MKRIYFLIFALYAFFLVGCTQRTLDNSDKLTTAVTLTAIEATPREGEAPLDVSFLVHLLNVEGFEKDYYCPVTTWDFGDGEREAIMPSCLTYDEVKEQDEAVEVSYMAQHTYTVPGTYIVRFTIQELTSVPITITVFGNEATSCVRDSDCVAAQCCHPTNAVNKNYAPNCATVLCDASCEGPLDCGAGKPVCTKEVCTIQRVL